MRFRESGVAGTPDRRAGALLLDRLAMKFPLSLPGLFGRSAS